MILLDLWHSPKLTFNNGGIVPFHTLCIFKVTFAFLVEGAHENSLIVAVNTKLRCLKECSLGIANGQANADLSNKIYDIVSKIIHNVFFIFVWAAKFTSLYGNKRKKLEKAARLLFLRFLGYFRFGGPNGPRCEPRICR